MEMAIASDSFDRSSAKQLRRIILGGDWIRPSLAQKLMGIFPNAELFSVGGPTETTVWNIYHKINKADIQQQIIPYGRPFPNTQYFILNDLLELRPIGVTGTMYVGGESLAEGYAGMPLETEKRFIHWNNRRIYNTGDLGVYAEDGTVQIKGRCDDQIKINGKRIEPSGIEQVMNNFDGVINSVVLVNAHSHKLVAYYTAGQEFPETDLLGHMRRILPEYMIPSAIMYIKDMPLARNGKVDRKCLSEQYQVVTKNLKRPNDNLIIALSDFCKEILSDENILPDMNFYMMGGDSVSSLRIISKIKDRFSVELSISEILENPTLTQWADLIREKQAQNEARLKEARKNVARICTEVFGSSLQNKTCLLDFNNIMDNAEIIARKINIITQKTVSKYDVICNPFAESWIHWMIEPKEEYDHI